MGRRKGRRQPDLARLDAESTDTERGEEQGPGPVSCPHVGKAVQLANIKKSLKVAWVRVGQCTVCYKEQTKSSSGVQQKRVKNEVLRREFGGKLSSQEIKRLQLERAKAERLAAAEKLQKIKETSNMKSANLEAFTSEEKTEPGAEDSEDKKAREEKEKEKEVSGPASCWLCMRCGSQGCGNNNKKHSYSHYKVPRSDLHCLTVNTTDWTIWCYECQTEISVDTHKKLYEVVELIKKTKDQPLNNNSRPMSSMAGSSLMSYSTVTSPTLKTTQAGGKTVGKSNRDLLPRVKGLNNLGNTCFFNSVMQCLSQTKPLTQLIEDQVSGGLSFSISGSCVQSQDESESSDCPTTGRMLDVYSDLSVKLAPAGPLLTSLAGLFKEMVASSKSSVISPGQVFSQVVRVSNKFRGMQQQDSHELLRYLMDGLRTEESKRQKSAILKYFGLTEKSDPKTVPGHLKKKLHGYGRESGHTLLDKIFSGQLVSSIVCEECHHSSQNYEQFLDLSLPVLEERPAKPSKKFSVVVSEDESTSLITSRRNKSKMLRKKDRMKRKKGKGGRNLPRKNSRAAMEEEEEQEKDEKDEEQEEQEEQEEEQEEEEGEQKIREELKGTEESEKVQLVVESDITNSDNSKEKADEGFEEEKVGEADWEWDYGDPWEEKQHIVFRSTARTEDNPTETDLSTDKTEENLSEADVSTARTEDNPPETDASTAKTEDNLTEVESLSPVQLVSINLLPEEESHQVEESLSRPSSSLSSVSVNSEEEEEDVTGASSDGDIEDNNDDDQRWVMSKNLINNLTKLDSLMKTSGNLEPRLASLCDSMSSLKLETGTGLSPKQRMTAEWTSRSLTSLGPRYQATPGECSVYTCLNNFTQSELLTGSNKWGCQACTDQRKLDNSDTSSGEQKTVYTPASKQLLIFSPPAILTLHLKRFQQTLSGCKKLNKHVSFPFLLDLAPFCSSTSLAMPSVNINSTKINYSLYGVVEHSGGLTGGHYTACVKVRPDQMDLDYQHFFSPSLSRPGDIPKFLQEIQNKVKQARVSGVEDATEEGKPKTLDKKWFLVSDSQVSEISEERVLKSQAYLLFYERIL